jgi:hypothetical protein
VNEGGEGFVGHRGVFLQAIEEPHINASSATDSFF